MHLKTYLYTCLCAYLDAHVCTRVIAPAHARVKRARVDAPVYAHTHRRRSRTMIPDCDSEPCALGVPLVAAGGGLTGCSGLDWKDTRHYILDSKDTRHCILEWRDTRHYILDWKDTGSSTFLRPRPEGYQALYTRLEGYQTLCSRLEGYQALYTRPEEYRNFGVFASCSSELDAACGRVTDTTTLPANNLLWPL